MRGSWHDKGIREYTITGNGADIRDSLRNFERIISGSPTRISVNEKSELSRIIQGVKDDDELDDLDQHLARIGARRDGVHHPFGQRHGRPAHGQILTDLGKQLA